MSTIDEIKVKMETAKDSLAFARGYLEEIDKGDHRINEMVILYTPEQLAEFKTRGVDYLNEAKTKIEEALALIL